MRKERPEPRLGQPGSYEKVFREGEMVLLTARARWPQLEENSPGCRRVSRYYRALADRWIKRWEGPLLEQARAAAVADTPPWEVRLEFTITLFERGLLSLTWQVTEDRGEHRPRRVRQGDTWRLPEGTPVTLRELLPPHRWWKGPVFEEVRRQIGAQVNAGEAVFFPEWPSLVSRKFSPDRFYLTPEGPTIFYPQESIAPAMEGFPSFPLHRLAAQKKET